MTCVTTLVGEASWIDAERVEAGVPERMDRRSVLGKKGVSEDQADLAWPPLARSVVGNLAYFDTSKDGGIFHRNVGLAETTASGSLDADTVKGGIDLGAPAKDLSRSTKSNQSLETIAIADASKIDILVQLFASTGAAEPRELSLRLLDWYGSISALLHAHPNQLVCKFGIDQTTVKILQLMRDLVRAAAGEELADLCLISSNKKLDEYLSTRFKGATREQARILFLNKKNYLIVDLLLWEGTVDHAPLYPREVLQLVLDYHASAVILVHNHPSGDPTPSEADIEITQQLHVLLTSIGVTLHDHVIVGRQKNFSMRAAAMY